MVQEFGPLTLGLATASLAASAGGVWASIRFARRVGVVDVPNERSSHAVPTPRMGGVPMVGAAVVAYGGWSLWTDGVLFPAGTEAYGMVFALVMSALGFWDDLSGLSPLFRFLIQLAGSVLVLRAAAGMLPAEPVLWSTVELPRAVWIPVGALWVVWLLNLYNFMDGIDGIAGGEAALASSFFFLVFAWHGESGWAVANLFIAAASMGFLVHNWPPARVFMGDAGSAFLGAFFGVQSIVAALTTAVPFPVLVLPFINFILDTTATLIRRMLKGEKWYSAHRSHYYQRMTNLGMSHARVTGLELVSVALSCLAALLYLRSGVQGKIVIISSVLFGFFAAGIWISKRSPLLSDTSPITGQE